MEFDDRRDAGRRLVAALHGWRGRPGLLVLGLPRGGVPVARVVADALGAPLDVLVVRKLGLPGHEEFAMGAIGPGGICVRSEACARWPVSQAVLDRVIARERAELDRRERRYRGERAPLVLAGRELLLVDDGLATGATMKAAVMAARAAGPQRIGVAVPVASREAVQSLEALADEVLSVFTPEHFLAVGAWYRDFAQTSDDEVCALLKD
ncbi:phosphoribosyltransferase family protein [Variovorax sp. J22P168]|uniref:phosphoribosyltransferase n=1 Tax=Variovorax jilinensis TaxID=3053513 RepID=UPI0025784DF0|nr:phosphoribosyltransferase family protein [Variovorax sp. J22P168]MDM0011375.1 phosphoribosyltransferase family protein [Variovorax sp. J22P168]